MGNWHQIANATAMIAFSIALLVASQTYVASRSAAGMNAMAAPVPRHAGDRAPLGR